MNVSSVESLDFDAPEVVAFTVDEMPATNEDWALAISQLDFPRLIGSVATHREITSHPTSYTMTRHPEAGKTRDWWAGDHLLHVDGTRWDQQPDMTVIGCTQADQGAPGTVLLDTVALRLISIEDEFWARWGFDQDDVDHDLFSVFADSTYYREALPYLKNFMNDDEKLAIEEIIQNDLEATHSENSEELLAYMDKCFPPKEFPLIRSTPFSGLAALFLDGGGHNSKLVDFHDEDHTEMLHDFRRNYLSDDIPEQLGIIETIEWKPNQCVMFPQVGVLHQAQPGNQHNRKLQLGFLNVA